MNENDVLVFSKNNCVQCESTKAKLDDLGVQYTVLNIDEQPEYLDKLLAMGFRSAPVVFAKGEAWAGYKEDKILEVFGS